MITRYDVDGFDVLRRGISDTTTLYFEDSRGEVLDLDNAETFWPLFGSISGFSGSTGAPQTIDLPDYTATELTITKHNRRVPSVSLQFTGTSRSNLEEKANLLINMFAQEKGLGKLHFHPASGEWIYLRCMAGEGQPAITLQSANSGIAKIDFVAPDPHYYSEIPHTLEENGKTYNPGDSNSPCKFTAAADTVTNTRTGISITAAASSSIIGVEIDTTPGKIRATLNGANAMHLISVSSRLDKFVIMPGENTISGATNLVYRPCWRGQQI